MAEFVADCPRCSTKAVTFTVCGDAAFADGDQLPRMELMGQCRNCGRSSLGIFSFTGGIANSWIAAGYFTTQHSGSVQNLLELDRFVSVIDSTSFPIPEHLPQAVANCFQEGASAFAIGAYNASAAMFRLSLDIATKGLLPSETGEQGGPNSAQRKRLYDRLEYLFNKRLIAPELRDLAECVREDGNDGAHDGTLIKTDAEDLIDFAEQLLERVYTEPARLRAAKARRDARRAS